MYPTALNYLGRSKVAQPIRSRKPTPSPMRRVQIGVMKTVPKLDNKAPADAVKDQSALQSVDSERLSAKEYSRKELLELQSLILLECQSDKPKVKKLKESGKHCKIYEHLSISNKAPMSRSVETYLVYHPKDGDDQAKCMVSLEEYPKILEKMIGHLETMPNPTTFAKKREAEKFVKQHFYLNWRSFSERYQVEIDAATGRSKSEKRTVSEQCAMATEPMSLLDKRTEAMTATKHPKPKPATERNARRAPAQATMIPMPSATAEKTKAASVVKRELIDGTFPQNMHDSECGKCQRAWINKYAFCPDHEDLLDVMTKIVHD